MPHSHLVLTKEVQTALQENHPVVALESTIIAHGMPYPQNVETALTVEKIIKDAGAIPATIAVTKGKLKAGLTVDEIDALGRTGKGVQKLSRRDLSIAVSQKTDGATTVATTMIIAQLAGIRVFATGGIGGVHRGAQQNFDISADLQELAHTQVAVVCAGAKAILDLGLTLEYLETHGVPVIGYQCHELPAFYSRKSGHVLNHRMDKVEDIAAMMKVHWEIGLQSGILVTNPIPEAYAMDDSGIDQRIEEAIQEAAIKGIQGKELTPFLLGRIKELTGGESLKSNIQLVYNNAFVAANLAKAYAKLV